MTTDLRRNRLQREAEFGFDALSNQNTGQKKLGDKNWSPQNCLNPPSYEFVSESI